LDWLESGTVVALLGGDGFLTAAFFINESLVRQPWAHANVLFSRNVGLALSVVLLYTLTSLSNSSLAPNFLVAVVQLRPERQGVWDHFLRLSSARPIRLLTSMVFGWRFGLQSRCSVLSP
jgi:hypothetical protein